MPVERWKGRVDRRTGSNFPDPLQTSSSAGLHDAARGCGPRLASTFPSTILYKLRATLSDGKFLQ